MIPALLVFAYLAVVLYIWVILWAAAFVVPEREHVMFDLVWNLVGTNARRAMRIAGHAMIGGLSVWALPATWDYVRFMAREGTPVLGVPFMWVFLPFALLLAALAVRSAWGIWRARDINMARVCSAVVTVFPAAAFMTTMPRRVAAPTSMLSTPVPARPTTRSRVPRASRSSVTLVLLRTIRPS